MSRVRLQIRRDGVKTLDQVEILQCALEVLCQIAAARALPGSSWDKGIATFAGVPTNDGGRATITIEPAGPNA